MSSVKHRVTIKGVKDGLVFLLDDGCPFSELLDELQHKLEKTHQKILTGPLIHVYVKLGQREPDEDELEQIRTAIGKQQNLVIQSIESEAKSAEPPEPGIHPVEIVRGMIRSGQTFEYEGNVMLLGDVNPGGTISSTGDIYIMGSLRGMAHAGSKGDESAIIAASHLRPTQLRIAGIISRPPDEWGIDEAFMEFAYIKDSSMKIDKIQHLAKIRPDRAE